MYAANNNADPWCANRLCLWCKLLFSLFVLLNFQTKVRSQETTPPASQSGAASSPSDRVAPPAGESGPVRMQLADPVTGSQAGSQVPGNQGSGNQTQPPALPRTTPQVSSLGNNALNSLSRSNYYASPFAVALGAGDGRSNDSMQNYFNSRTHRSLLRTPEMFGDFRRPGFSILFDPFAGNYNSSDDQHPRPTDFPAASSFSGLRVSENNVALPQDRIWFGYNYMHNAFLQPGGDLSLNRFTIGFEKTFFGGNSSVEVRLPMAGGIEPTGTFGGSTIYSGGSFGNLSILLKRVLLAGESKVLAAGLAIETPTGSQSHAQDTGAGLAQITIDPSAVYLTPYLGALCVIDDIWFVNSFLQIDVPTSGERMWASLGGNPAQEYYLNKPTTLQFDIGGGVWLWTPARNRCGVALTTELHLATAIDELDSFSVVPGIAQPNVFVNQGDAIQTILNSTTGLHTQLQNGWSVRTAVSVPMLVERIFDTEFLVQVNRKF